jgi:lysine 2,3-aminomutase
MKRKMQFRKIEPWPGVPPSDWTDWKWQMRHSLKSREDFARHFSLTEPETKGFSGQVDQFRVQTTPFYASVAQPGGVNNPVRRIILPLENELLPGAQQMLDPLGENKPSNRATERLIHRYTDRALFLTTDLCGVYCRYCTRKHFTASDQVVASRRQVQESVDYVRAHPEIKEVIFSGGDPLTLGNGPLTTFLQAFYDIDTVELIRIGSRIPAVNPFRIDDELLQIFKKYQPIYFMTHFNHPEEITEDSAQALSRLVDQGVPVFNQMVLLHGINDKAETVYQLSRRLLYLRVKPYYMFQADPSLGTDHLRTSIDESLEIQKQLWGHASGLAMPTYIVDIPDGGGKAAMTPDFLESREGADWHFRGWDGVQSTYRCRE